MADSAHVPYGEKSPAAVAARARAIADRFVRLRAKAIVVACNTATAAAIGELRALHPGRIIIGVEPAIKPAAHLTASGVIGVFATTGTLASPRFAALAQREAPEVRILLKPCPQWVRLVEQGELEGAAGDAARAPAGAGTARRGRRRAGAGLHAFPFLRAAIQAAAGPA
ncbi:glutamate racemase [Achromobacter sp. DMS1]|uniref:glutamate racemase n=1 Tax=Achromobacter sp. DMS1 TaxID=1688405 RepID=UPI000AF4C361|nr:aspartate/glutamate racemase family protein [Achromobacter sp. DMS1]